MRIRGASTTMVFVLGGGTNERREERVWGKRLGLEFRMKLASQEPGMVRRFDDFDVNAVMRFAANFESRSS